jgi:hypothetical protein
LLLLPLLLLTRQACLLHSCRTQCSWQQRPWLGQTRAWLLAQTQVGSLALPKMASSQISSSHSTGMQQQEGGALHTRAAGSTAGIIITTTTGQLQRQSQVAGQTPALLLQQLEEQRRHWLAQMRQLLLLQALRLPTLQQRAAGAKGTLLTCILQTEMATAGLLHLLAGPSTGAASTAPTLLHGLSAVVPAVVGSMVQGSAAVGRKQTVLASRGTKALAMAAAGIRATSKILPPVAVITHRRQQLHSTGQQLCLLLAGTLGLGRMVAWAVWLALCRAWQAPCRAAQQDTTTQQQDGPPDITGTITALPATISTAQALLLAAQSRVLPPQRQLLLLLAALPLQLPTPRLHLQALLGPPWPLLQRLLLAQQRQLYRMQRCCLVTARAGVCPQTAAAAQGSMAAAAMAPAAAMGSRGRALLVMRMMAV